MWVKPFEKLLTLWGSFLQIRRSVLNDQLLLFFAFVSSWYNLKITLFILRHNYLFIDCLFRGAILFMSLLFISS